MSTPTNEREAALRERLAGAETAIRDGGRIHGFALLEIFAEATWALSRIEELAKERDTLVAAVKWALGEEGEFVSPPDGLVERLHLGRVAQQAAGVKVAAANRLYWWRGELRRRAGLSTAAPAKSAVENSAASSSGANTP